MAANEELFAKLKADADQNDPHRMVSMSDLARRSAHEDRGGKVTQPPPEYCFAVYGMLVYLDRFTSYPVGIAKMAKEDSKAYSLGYARPLKRAGVPTDVFLAAADRYLAKQTDFPKSPAALIPFCEAEMRDRERSGPLPDLALPAPPVRPETRKAAREKLLKEES
ncbi:hypothetical protein EON81_09355 [bacterium]|nr:MAG: hypothetical protein EON81_09355 [bacterium]